MTSATALCCLSLVQHSSTFRLDDPVQRRPQVLVALSSSGDDAAADLPARKPQESPDPAGEDLVQLLRQVHGGRVDRAAHQADGQVP